MSEYISKTELKQELKKHLPTFHHIVDEVIDNTMTSVDAAPVVHGHWENKYERYYIFFGTCSVCKHVCQENYICGNCGAIMYEEEQHEEKTNA